MLKKINGSELKNMINYGINYLDKHCAVVNDLNVFPVPDGDTGTNMVMTMKNGYESIGDASDLSDVARSFANATVFGARGNSGVILSQFFKGISKGLDGEEEADVAVLSMALNRGCEYAYSSVAKPVEGTILTVIKDASAKVAEFVNVTESIDDAISIFIVEAKKSLDNTPNILPILAKAGVVDSGGAGIVYFFEGIQRYLRGESLESVETSHSVQFVDYSAFNQNSKFEFGYCTETLIQLTIDVENFDFSGFVRDIESLGESVVASLEGDKVKLHVHTPRPEEILQYCHKYGEFLSMKIENMSVQHTQNTQKIAYSDNINEAPFAVVAVAPNAHLQSMLIDMGADAVIMSEEAPSSQDFIEAFENITVKDILVFPNSSNSILSAMQAGTLHKKARITVLNSRSIAECYCALPLIDYDCDLTDVVETVNETVAELYQVSVVHAEKNISYGNKTVVKNDYFALAGEDIIVTADKFENAVRLTVEKIMDERDCSVINLFYGKNISEERIEKLADEIRDEMYVDVCTISTQNAIYDLVMSFE